VLDEVNGVKIKQIGDILTALKTPVTASTSSSSIQGQAVQEIVLDASNLDQVNTEIMARYHIPADHYLNGEPCAQAIGDQRAVQPVWCSRRGRGRCRRGNIR
jgi:hypothetical protein